MSDALRDQVKDQIMQALSHPEADEGLYFRNLYHLHEEDERPGVIASPEAILKALEELITDGHVQQDITGEEPVFIIVR